MNPEKLPTATPFINAHHDVLQKFSDLISIEGKKCLCIGYDETQLKDYVLKYQPASVVLLTLWEGHKDSRIEGYRVVVGDIGKRTSFAADSFDFVITLSVLEHINDLEGGFAEIRRILKPNGYFASLFGPAWSCNVGHHIYANPGHPLFDFLQWRIPSHIHLLASVEEIFEYYRGQGATEAECATVAQWFFETDIINRVFFDDYVKLFYRHFYFVASSTIYSEIDPKVLSMLRERYPGYQDFSTYGGSFLLKNFGSPELTG